MQLILPVLLLVATSLTTHLPTGTELRFEKLWSKPSPEFVTQFGSFVNLGQLERNSLLTSHGRLDLLDGTLTKDNEEVPQAFSGMSDVELRRVSKGQIKVDGIKLTLFWSTKNRELAYRALPDWHNRLYELEPTTHRILSQIDLPSTPPYLYGNPDSGCFEFQSGYSDRGLGIRYQILILKPLQQSKLPFASYYDISRPTQGVLGIPMPKLLNGGFMYLPDGPLTSGNPRTGKVLWTAEGTVGRGLWLGSHWVLVREIPVKSPENGSWLLFDGRTGKAVKTPIKDFPNLSWEAITWTLGPYLLVQNNSLDPTVVCYKLIER